MSSNISKPAHRAVDSDDVRIDARDRLLKIILEVFCALTVHQPSITKELEPSSMVDACQAAVPG
jgi:hypothetical protein